MKIREESVQASDPRMTALVQARKTVNAPELNELILSRHELDERTDAFLAKLQAQNHARLESEFESAKAAVREQLQAIEDTKIEIAKTQDEIYRLETLQTKRESAVSAAIARRNELGYYAAKKEVRAAEEAIERAEAKCAEVASELGPVKSHLHHLTLVTWPALGVELQKRTSEERRLRSAVEGDEEYTHASGLVLPAGARF